MPPFPIPFPFPIPLRPRRRVLARLTPAHRGGEGTPVVAGALGLVEGVVGKPGREEGGVVVGALAVAVEADFPC